MYNQRQNIDTQSMMEKGSALSRPRGPTPIRKAPIRMVGNKQNMLNPGNQWNMATNKGNNNYQQKQLLLPDNNIKKPLISPVRNPFKTQIQSIYEQQKRSNKFLGNQKQMVNNMICANHPNKNAQFTMQIEDQCLSYCSRCAAQLASQGFQVKKIQPPTVKKGDYQRPSNQVSSQRQLPLYPQYEGNPMYELIIEFLTQLSEVQNEHLQNMTKLTLIDSNYNEQIQQTKYFYSQLQNFIEQMRDDHINDLVQESRKHSQIADIEHDYLRENVQQIGNIRRDIEENLETIVEKLDEEDLKNNLNYYKQKLQVYKHKAQEQADFFDKVISYTPEQYQSKLNRVQDFLMLVWNTDDEVSQSQPQIQPQMQINLQQTQHHIYQPQHQNQEKFLQKFMPIQNVQQLQTRPMLQRQMPNLIKTIPNNIVQPQNSARGQLPAPLPNISKKPSNQMAAEPQNKSTAFRKLFQEDEDQVMAQTSPQFKKI